MGFLWLLGYSQVDCGLGDHCRTSLGLLWAFGGFLYTCLYNNAAKTFGTEGVVCRRFVNFAIKRC